MSEQGQWMEILGCGMVDPNVFKAVGIDSDKYTGWAFGIGIERITMLKYGMTDIRPFFENDTRFLNSFRRRYVSWHRLRRYENGHRTRRK